jgi:hypothetical protein
MHLAGKARAWRLFERQIKIKTHSNSEEISHEGTKAQRTTAVFESLGKRSPQHFLLSILNESLHREEES